MVENEHNEDAIVKALRDFQGADRATRVQERLCELTKMEGLETAWVRPEGVAMTIRQQRRSNNCTIMLDIDLEALVLSRPVPEETRFGCAFQVTVNADGSRLLGLVPTKN